MFHYTKSSVITLLCSTAISLSSFLLPGYASAETFHSPIVDAVDQGDEHTLLRFLQQGYPVDGQGDFNTTSLMRAAYKGNTRLVRILLSVGADPNAHDISGTTPLHLAARQGYDNVVNLLIEHGANVNATDEEGWTPLMRAALANKPSIMKILIGNGADTNQVNNWDESVLLHAVESGSVDAVEVLMDSGIAINKNTDTQSALQTAIRKGNTAITDLLYKLIDKTETLNKLDAGSPAITIPASPTDSLEAIGSEKHVPTTKTDTYRIPFLENSVQTDMKAEIPKVQVREPGATEKTIPTPETSSIPLPKTDVKDAIHVSTRPPIFLDFEAAPIRLSEAEFQSLHTGKKELPVTKTTASNSTTSSEQEVSVILKKNREEEKAPIVPRIEETQKKQTVAFTAPVNVKQEMVPASPVQQTAVHDNTDARKAPTENIFLLQLGTYRSSADAKQGWDILESQNHSLLSGQQHHIEQSTLAGSNNALMLYQLRSGNFSSKQKADALCAALWKHEVDCFVMEQPRGLPRIDATPARTLPSPSAFAENVPPVTNVIHPTAEVNVKNHPSLRSPMMDIGLGEPIALLPEAQVIPLVQESLQPLQQAKREEGKTIDGLPWLTEAQKFLKAPDINTDTILASAKKPAGQQNHLFKKPVPAKEKSMPKPMVKQVKQKEAKVEIAEAIRVSGRHVKTLPMETERRRPKLQHVSLPPSEIVHDLQKPLFEPPVQYWVQVGNFPTQKVAISFARMIKKNNDVEGLRLRVVKLKAFELKNEPAVAIQLGMFASLAKAKSLCSEDLSYMRCTIIKDINSN